MKTGDRLLRDAAAAHKRRHPSHVVKVYGNFVECETCYAHAHIDPQTGNFLIAHSANWEYHEAIEPHQF